MQVQQLSESAVIPIDRDAGPVRDASPFSPFAISAIKNPYADDPAMGGRPGHEVDRAIGSVRCLIVQLDNRIGYTRRSLVELEEVRSRLMNGLEDLSHAGSS